MPDEHRSSAMSLPNGRRNPILAQPLNSHATLVCDSEDQGRSPASKEIAGGTEEHYLGNKRTFIS